MSYMGRIEIRVLKEGDYIEVLDLNCRANRDIQRSGYAGSTVIEEIGVDDIVRDVLKGRTDGVHDIWGTYHEDWSQDYWGEWDCDFRIEKERVRLVGNLPADFT